MASSVRIFTGVYLVVVVATATLGVSSAPSPHHHHHRWHRQCPTPESADTAHSTQQRFRTILTLAEEARNTTDSLILRYLNERFHSSAYTDEYADFRINGVPQVPRRDMSKINVNRWVDESRQWVARCIVFVEQTKQDQAIEEEEYGHSFFSDTEQLVHDYENLFCELNTTLGELVSPLKPASALVNMAHVMDRYLVPESVALRQLRDYIVLRDCLKVVAETSRTFRVLRRRALRRPAVKLQHQNTGVGPLNASTD